MKSLSAPTDLDLREVIASIETDFQALSVRDTSQIREIRRKYSRALKSATADAVLQLARALCEVETNRWFAYELVCNHPRAFQHLNGPLLENFARGLNSWGAVDSFARILSGPAWLAGRIPDALIIKWARSKDRWWRRAALVSTVALNMRSQGGTGDTACTLRICRLLSADHDDMVAKGLSWALRQLVAHDPRAVQSFLNDHQAVLQARVKREVKNKLKTGLKNPRRRF